MERWMAPTVPFPSRSCSRVESPRQLANDVLCSTDTKELVDPTPARRAIIHPSRDFKERRQGRRGSSAVVLFTVSSFPFSRSRPVVPLRKVCCRRPELFRVEAKEEFNHEIDGGLEQGEQAE